MDDLDKFDTVVLVNGAHGVYVPRQFVLEYLWDQWGVDEDDAKILKAGPDHDEYWEAWDAVLNDAALVVDGKAWSLHQGESGDLFAIAPLPEPELFLCENCHTYEQTRDATFFDAHYDEKEAAIALRATEEGLANLGRIQYAGEAFDEEFSTERCACGTWRMGARYGYYNEDSAE